MAGRTLEGWERGTSVTAGHVKACLDLETGDSLVEGDSPSFEALSVLNLKTK